MAEASNRSRGKSTLSRPSKVANSISSEKPLDWAASLRSGDGSRANRAARPSGSAKRGRGGSARKRGGGRSGQPVVIDISSSEDACDDDDECRVLDSDPLLPTLKKISLAGTPDAYFKDDDIAIIYEKGQVACRDYPHSRHLCVKYPFNTTTHDTCCSKCYCYVCDVLAPCKNWNGIRGHCHASDQDQKWKDMRRAGIAR